MDHLSWQWRPHIAGCKLFLTLLGAEFAVLTQLFCKMYQYICEEAQNQKWGVFITIQATEKYSAAMY